MDDYTLIAEKKRNQLVEEKRKISISYLNDIVQTNTPPIKFFEFLSKNKSKLLLLCECKISLKDENIEHMGFDPINYLNKLLAHEAQVFAIASNRNSLINCHEFTKLKDYFNTIPFIQKDLIVDEYQIWQARALSADSFVLISELFDTPQLQYFCEIGRDIGMEAIVESSSIDGIYKAFETDSKILYFNLNENTIDDDFKRQILDAAFQEDREIIWSFNLFYNFFKKNISKAPKNLFVSSPHLLNIQKPSKEFNKIANQTTL